MKKILFLVAISATVSLTTSCGNKKKASNDTDKSTMSDSDRKKHGMDILTKTEALAVYTDEIQTDGHKLLQDHCVKCHALPDPTTKTDIQWFKTLNKMIPKTKMTDAEKLHLRVYVVAHSK